MHLASRRAHSRRRSTTVRLVAGTAAVAVVASSFGATAVAADPNPQPAVVPSLQEWTGGEGDFRLTDETRIVVDDESADVGATLAADLAELTGRSVPVTQDAAAAGDVVLSVDESLSHEEGGEDFTREGYLLEIDDQVEISAPTTTGVFYGTRSILQVLLQSGDRSTLPQGESADWPDYESRGFMLDVGRRYFTPEFLRDYIAMMSWYKLNEFQIHLNDNEIHPANGDWSQAYSAFRLETDNPEFAGLAADDGTYDRDDWQSFEDVAAQHHMMLIPEIDAPAHARAIVAWKPELGRDGGNSDLLDLGNPESTEVMKDIWSEFIPWFESPEVHIGTDEYPHHLADDFRDFFNDMAAHVRSEGKHPRAWGSFNVMHDEAEGYDRDVTINSWNSGYYGLADAARDGYEFINTNDATLYVVPFANYYHGNGLNNGSLYDNWLPHASGGQEVEPGVPNGAMFAVWNDLVHDDYTELDVHGLVRDSFPVIAQKTWKAEAPGLTYAAFSDVLDVIGQGPGLEVISEGEATGGELGFGAEASASASDEGFPASHLTDGQANTRWQDSSGEPATLTVDLGEDTTIGALEVDWSADAAASYSVEVSSDGVFWQHVADHVNEQGAGVDGLTFAAHDARYVRLSDVTPAGEALGAWRLSVFGTQDLALGQPTTAVGVEPGTQHTADLATDGSSATRWSSSYVSPSWIQVDLGEPTAVDSVRLNWESASAADYTVDVSDDGETWETVATRTDMATGARVDDVTFDSTTARYVRVHVTENNLDIYLSLFDFEVRSSAPAPLTVAASVEPAAAESGWITEAPTLTLTPGGSGTGEVTLEYRVGDGEWLAYTEPVVLDAQGVTTIEYRAARGEDTASGYGTLLIDTAAPSTSIVTDPVDGTGELPAGVTVTFAATDEGSGVAYTEYRIGDGEWTVWDGEPLVLTELGEHEVSVRSVDELGFFEDVQTRTVTVLEESTEPTPDPTDSPDPEPTESPDPEPTDSPDPEPTDSPDPEPTDSPDPEPTDSPDPEPSATTGPTAPGGDVDGDGDDADGDDSGAGAGELPSTGANGVVLGGLAALLLLAAGALAVRRSVTR